MTRTAIAFDGHGLEYAAYWKAIRIARALASRVGDSTNDHENARRFPFMGLASGWLSMPASLSARV